MDLRVTNQPNTNYTLGPVKKAQPTQTIAVSKPKPLPKIKVIPVNPIVARQIIKPRSFLVSKQSAFRILGATAFKTKSTTSEIIKPGAENQLAELGKSILRAAPRTTVAAILSAQNKPPLTPETKFEKFVLGNEPVKPLSQTVAEGELTAKGLGFGKSSLPIAFGLTLGGSLLDLIPGFPGKKKIGKEVAEFVGGQLVKKIAKKEIVLGVEKQFGKEAAEAITKNFDALASKVVKTAETGLKERSFITSVKEAKPEFKVAGQYVPRSTDELSIKAANLVKSDIRTAEKLAMTGTDENAVATASELLKHYSDEAAKATDETIKNAYYDKGAEVANTIAHKLTEQGRSVQAASILGRLTPEGQVKFAAREIQKYNEAAKLGNKIPELTGKQSRYIIDEMNAIGKMADGTEKAIRFQKLQNYVSDLVPSSLMDKITTIWKAGLLTGMKTTGVNIFSNISHFGSEIIKDLPATVVDKVASLFTGKRTIAFTSKGVGGGLQEGFQKGLRYLKTGFDERNIAQKLDWKRVNFGSSKVGKVLQKYEESIFHLLGAEDQPFYYGAKSRSIASQAIAQGKNSGLKGAELQKFVQNLVEKPTDDMLKYAVIDAQTAVFQNKTALGQAAKKIQEIGGGAGEFIVPFGRTPSAVATQIINYSPVGIAKAIFENVGKGKFDQRLFSQAIGRGLTGTAVLALGGLLLTKDLLALDRPTGEREQKLWELEGRKANSIKIGDKWRSIQVLGPLGNTLLIGAHIKDAFQKFGSPSQAIGQAVSGSIKSFSEQTFLTGINQLVNALNDPERSAKSWVASTASSVIPTILGDVARATDPKERRTEAVLDRLAAKIPGLRETLQPQVNVLGKEIDRIGNPLEVMADPTRPTNIIESPVILELRRLFNAGLEVSPTLLGDRAGYKGLTPEENTLLWKRAGEITNAKLGSLFQSEQYQKLPDDQKGKVVTSFVDKSKLYARVGMVIKLTEGLGGDELKKKLAELKASGLMTREVFNEWQKLR